MESEPAESPDVLHMRPKRGRPKRGKPPQVVAGMLGRKHLRSLLKLRKKLRKTHAHPNRTLHYDNVVVVQLIAFFNPIIRSLRMIEDFSSAPLVQDELEIERICRSTLSDANRLFDPGLLEPMIEELRKQVPDLERSDASLGKLLKQMRLVDGSFFHLAADVQWAFRKGKPWAENKDDCFVRLDLQLCASTGTPECLEINGRGTSETTFAKRHIEEGMLYVADRGIFSFAYIDELLTAKADFVLRIKTSQKFAAHQERELTGEDRKAGVLSDKNGTLTGDPRYRPAPQAQLREVIILDPNNPGHLVRLLTNRMDLPAYLVGEIYRCRWQIELFFRWFKVHANFRHLISESRNGIAISFYVAVIGTLMMYLHTGRKISKYALGMLGLVASGQARMEDILPILERRERERDLERQRLARKKAAQKNAV